MVQGHPQAYTSYPCRRSATKQAAGCSTEGISDYQGASAYSCESVHDQWSAYPAEEPELRRIVEIRGEFRFLSIKPILKGYMAAWTCCIIRLFL